MKKVFKKMNKALLQESTCNLRPGIGDKTSKSRPKLNIKVKK